MWAPLISTTSSFGDSIANNGVCLTVIAQDGKVVSFDVSRETLNCTVGLDAPGRVNLRALRLADRLGGHLVTGHVDGIGSVQKFEPVGERPRAHHPRSTSPATSPARVRSPSTA